MTVNQLNVELTPEPGKSDEQVMAEFMTSPQANAAMIQREFTVASKEDMDLQALTRLLSETCGKAVNGSSARGVVILAAQAEALNAIFTKLATRASANMSEGYLGASETYLRLALKAQNQSKSAIEALSRIQNPRLASYVGQLNATTGPQQVNNAQSSRLEIAPNEVLEVENGNRMDERKKASPISGNSDVEALG